MDLGLPLSLGPDLLSPVSMAQAGGVQRGGAEQSLGSFTLESKLVFLKVCALLILKGWRATTNKTWLATLGLRAPFVPATFLLLRLLLPRLGLGSTGHRSQQRNHRSGKEEATFSVT